MLRRTAAARLASRRAAKLLAGVASVSALLLIGAVTPAQAAMPHDTCVQGYVWREAVPGDHVCVTPDIRSEAAYDNSQAASRVDPNGAYGPDSCIQGYVWREAVTGDHVCVTPDVRSQTWADNAAAASRVVDCSNLNTFTLSFGTGGDDLRGDSEVVVWLTTISGEVELQHVWGPMGNWSSSIVKVGLVNPNWNVSACDITGVVIRMISHNGFLETDDNWEVDYFQIDGILPSNSIIFSASAIGSPVKRFTGSNPYWTLATP
jgi:hypothetical protein